ncbi:MAG TPA: TolC family protein [Gemmatimonadales bacterium]|nr:TolC family protein [Gemmatimonadales bacterium]
MIIAIYLSLVLQAPPDTVALSLDAAIARALAENPTLRGERAEALAAGQLPLAASRAFLPTVQAEVTGVRTTDPVAVFGMKLRQGVFAADDLALDALNAPASFGGFSSGVRAELPLLALEGLFGYAAARRAADARAAGAGRAAGAMVVGVTQAYWGAQLAERRLEALDTALGAARAHERQAEALRGQGLVTGLDARLARLQAAEVEVRRLAAAAEADNVRERLLALLAWPDSTAIQWTDTLGADRAGRCGDLEECAADDRGDLRALRAGAGAAGLAVKAACAAQLPQVAAFGPVSHHAGDGPWGSGSGDWTVGLGVRWAVFPALSGVGAVRKARAEAAAADARLEAARRQADLEVAAARRMAEAASAGLVVAAAAEEEAGAALEQARLRYRTGAAPITELLDVQAAATQATLNHLSARHDLLLARALLDFAYGIYDQ